MRDSAHERGHSEGIQGHNLQAPEIYLRILPKGSLDRKSALQTIRGTGNAGASKLHTNESTSCRVG